VAIPLTNWVKPTRAYQGFYKKMELISMSRRNPDQLVTDGLIEQRSRIEACVAETSSKRNSQLILILMRIPDEDYMILKDKNPWIVAPHLQVSGWNGRIPKNKSQIIYLPESLEGRENSEVKLIIAHELAHCVMGHTDSSSEDPGIEDEAWQKVTEWNFGTSEAVVELRKKLHQPSMIG
jgi:hypothetical protein